MPGRNDFAIIRARLLADDRLHEAARLYVVAGLATPKAAVATVIGHIAMLGIWTSRETDDGVLPGNGIGVAATSLMSPRDVAEESVSALLAAQLLRQVGRGLYVVGWRDCYRPLVNKRKRDRETAREARQRKAKKASARRRRDVGATSARRRDGVEATSHYTGPDRTVPDRTVIPPPKRAPARADEGGASATPPPATANGNGHAPLARDDLGVFEGLWRRRGRMLARDAADAERLRLALAAGDANPDEIREFVSRMTPSFVDDVQKLRRVFRMEAAGRREAGSA